jgi:hypothetical protein
MFFADCGSEHIRRAQCGKSARRDLSGGRWVTGVPTATGEQICFADQFQDIEEERLCLAWTL